MQIIHLFWMFYPVWEGGPMAAHKRLSTATMLPLCIYLQNNYRNDELEAPNGLFKLIHLYSKTGAAQRIVGIL